MTESVFVPGDEDRRKFARLVPPRGRTTRSGTATDAELRELLAEYGVVIPAGLSRPRRCPPSPRVSSPSSSSKPAAGAAKDAHHRHHRHPDRDGRHLLLLRRLICRREIRITNGLPAAPLNGAVRAGRFRVSSDEGQVMIVVKRICGLPLSALRASGEPWICEKGPEKRRAPNGRKHPRTQ